MATHPRFQAHLRLSPTFFVGIDVGKKHHVAAFVSAELLRTRRFEQCPILRFEQSRTGFVSFLERVKTYIATPAACAILVESTGHYHRALCEELADAGFSVYIVAVHKKRTSSLSKTDAADARRLAHSLYAQLALGLQLEEKGQEARQLVPDLEIAQRLRGLVQRRYEVAQSLTRSKNKLIAICDELFPEFDTVFRDPCAKMALDVRRRFPTPAALARAAVGDLQALRRNGTPSLVKLQALQEVAKTSIGVTGPHRVEALLFEQEQLLTAFAVTVEQAQALEHRIETLVVASREGQILLSFPGVGIIHAATLISFIGNIRNFPRKCDLRKYCGWSPRSTQTGTSFDRDSQTPTGAQLLKRAFWLIVTSVISQEHTVWHKLYYRLLPLKCSYDARKKEYVGRMRVVGRVAGQMVGVVWVLLKADADLVDHWDSSKPLPPPQLYDPAIHAGTRAKPNLTTSPECP